MEAKYSRGDRVIIKAFGNRTGIIDSEPRETKGKWFYPVSIDPSHPRT
jgi:hypothetical protein